MKGRDQKTAKSQKRKPASPDRLVKGRGAAKVERSEDELRKISGGNPSWPQKATKF